MEKSYGYIKSLQIDVVRKLIEEPTLMASRVQVAEDDPRRLRPTIAASIPKPVAELVEEHVTRLGTRLVWAKD